MLSNFLLNLNFLFWFPWFNFFFEIFFFQFFLFYCIYLFFNSSNVYYVILYFWILTIFLGILLAFVQMEMFLGFFWVVEFTVIFIALILVFYLNVETLPFNLNLFLNKIYFFFIFLLLLFFFIFSGIFFNFEFFYLIWNNFDYILDNYYESVSNFFLNDFLCLVFNYYLFNSFEFLLLGFILFFGSIICIILNFLSKKNSFIFDLFYLNNLTRGLKLTEYSFLRKQNFFKQNNTNASIRIFKKKS